jgi:hypothetical protein
MPETAIDLLAALLHALTDTDVLGPDGVTCNDGAVAMKPARLMRVGMDLTTPELARPPGHAPSVNQMHNRNHRLIRYARGARRGN